MSNSTKEPSGGVKMLVGMLYVVGVILQAVIIYYCVTV